MITPPARLGYSCPVDVDRFNRVEVEAEIVAVLRRTSMSTSAGSMSEPKPLARRRFRRPPLRRGNQGVIVWLNESVRRASPPNPPGRSISHGTGVGAAEVTVIACPSASSLAARQQRNRCCRVRCLGFFRCGFCCIRGPLSLRRLFSQMPPLSQPLRGRPLLLRRPHLRCQRCFCRGGEAKSAIWFGRVRVVLRLISCAPIGIRGRSAGRLRFDRLRCAQFPMPLGRCRRGSVAAGW